MDKNYLKWPAKKEEQIHVNVYNENSPVNTHRHDFVEIVFIAHGSCLHKYHSTEVNLIPGDIFIVVPHEEHSYKINAKTVIYNCLFYPEALGDDWKSLKEINGIYDLLMVEPFYRAELNRQEILHLCPSEASQIEIMLKAIMNEQVAKLTGSQLAIKANLILFLTFLGRAWEKQFNGDSYSYHGKREMLAEALSYIEQNLGEDLKIDDLAARVYLSPHYFRKVFREATGLTPIEYINKIRISKAVRLLNNKKLSVSEIAESVGIIDINYFSRLFRMQLGCSPTEFRKKSELY